MKRLRSRKEKGICRLVLLLLMVAATLLYSPVFYLNDDVTMRSILSGAYTGTPNGHAVYMQYPLTGLLALLYRLLPMCPWMELCFAGCIWVCMVLVAEEFTDKVWGSLFAVLLFLPFYLYMHYTIVAALAAGTAVFLLCRGKKNGWSMGLLWIAYMIRSQVGLLCLPFVIAALVWQVLLQKKDWKGRLLPVIKYVGLLAGGLLCISLIHHMAYRDSDWQEYLRYNDSRTQLYDYTNFLSTDIYGENPTDYGMTEEEYKLLSSYDTMLENQIDAVRMQEIADKVTESMQEQNGEMPGIREILKKYYLQVRYSDVPYNILWAVGYLVLVVVLIFCKKWLQLGYLGILGIGRSSIWMYLIWKGRFPERVSLSLYMIELLLLLGVALSFRGEVAEAEAGTHIAKFVGKLHRPAAAVILVCLLVTGGCLGKSTVDKVKERNSIQYGWNLLKDYCEENSQNIYLMDVFSAVSYADDLYEKDADNLMLLGGWLSASPLAKERLEAMGGSDASQALLMGENTRLVAAMGTQMQWLEEYLQNRFGECSLVQVDTISWRDGGFEIYQVTVQP